MRGLSRRIIGRAILFLQRRVLGLQWGQRTRILVCLEEIMAAFHENSPQLHPDRGSGVFASNTRS